MVCQQERSLPDGAPKPVDKCSIHLSEGHHGVHEAKRQLYPTHPLVSHPMRAGSQSGLLIKEIEQLDVFRQSILSQTGEILCVDGTKQVIFIFLFIAIIIIYQTWWGLQPSTFSSEYSSSNYESAGWSDN